MLKIYAVLFLFFISFNCLALCKTNEPMCDVNWQVNPIFIQDGWLSAGEMSPLMLSSPDRQIMKKNTPYTIRCLISLNNFVKEKDSDLLHIRGWTGVDDSKITYVEGNNEETNSHIPNIVLHYGNGYVYFKHLIVTDDSAVAYFDPFSHDSSYDCIALEEKL